ncbi:MAG: hypothetical protein PHO64_03255 [Thiomonas sp.]|nr:hypothetical protein [Thiomonas sp.]
MMDSDTFLLRRTNFTRAGLSAQQGIRYPKLLGGEKQTACAANPRVGAMKLDLTPMRCDPDEMTPMRINENKDLGQLVLNSGDPMTASATTPWQRW